jgi:hypothetical protein
MTIALISKLQILLKWHPYGFTPPRPLEVIEAELKQVTDRILEMIGGLTA